MNQQPALYPDATLRFLTESGRIRTKSSRDSYQVKLRALQYKHPGKRLKSFTAADLQAYCLEGSPAPATVNNRKSTVQSFFGWCKYVGLIAEDPAADLKWSVRPGKFGVRQHTWLSTEDVRRTLRSMPIDTMKDRRDRALVFTGLFTGLRLSGLVGLRWSSFTQDMGTVRLTVKGGKLMEVSVPDELHPILVAWRVEVSQFQGGDGPVFPAFHYGYDEAGSYCLRVAWGTPLGPAGARDAIKRVGLNPHDMRRSFANVLEEAGYSLQDISGALGHENISTTSTYLDRNPHRVMAVGRKLRIDL